MGDETPRAISLNMLRDLARSYSYGGAKIPPDISVGMAVALAIVHVGDQLAAFSEGAGDEA